MDGSVEEKLHVHFDNTGAALPSRYAIIIKN